MDIVDLDQTAQNVQSNIWYTLSDEEIFFPQNNNFVVALFSRLTLSVLALNDTWKEAFENIVGKGENAG